MKCKHTTRANTRQCINLLQLATPSPSISADPLDEHTDCMVLRPTVLMSAGVGHVM